MVSRGLLSVGSLLRGLGSRVATGPARSLYTKNVRGAVRLVSQRMSSSESSVPMTHRVSALDRFTLIATRTMKPPIPAEVAASTMEMANNRRRIGVNGVMIILTLAACVYIIKTSQKERKEQTLVSLHERNVQRYEKLRQEDAAAAAAAAEAKSGK